jgi:hypothetical protein
VLVIVQATFDTSISGAEPEEDPMDVDEEEEGEEPVDGEVEGEQEEPEAEKEPGNEEEEATTAAIIPNEEAESRAIVPPETLSVSEVPGEDGQVVDIPSDAVHPPATEIVSAEEIVSEPSTTEINPDPTVKPIPSNAVEAHLTSAHETQFGASLSSESAEPGAMTFTTGTDGLANAETAGKEKIEVQMEGTGNAAIPLGEGDGVGAEGEMELADEDMERANQAEIGE